MTAIATAPVMSNHDSGAEAGPEHSPSRFTAVNGKDSSVPAAVNVGHAITAQERGSLGPEIRDNSRIDMSERENKSPDGGPRSSPSEGPFTNHKRKRSDSGEHLSRHPSEPGTTGRSSVSHPTDVSAPPNSSGIGSGSASDVEPTAPGRSDAQESSQPPSNGPWPEYDTQLVSQAQRAQQMDASDAHLADALQREAHAQDPSHRLNRPTPAPTAQSASSPVYASERPTSAVQVAPKRKRVFSNRTKTGCMTCRRRKKKCDEQHPACNNCLRGGFLCEGYSSRSTWQKPSSSKAPIPLQSKEGYPEISGQYITEPHHDRQLTEHMDSRKMRPILVEEERPPAQYNTSPTETTSTHPSWPKRGWLTTGHPAPTYPSEHVPKTNDYREVPSMHELPREAAPKPDYPLVPPLREVAHGPPPKANMPLLFQGATAPPVPVTATMDTNSPQVQQARMALNIENQISSRPPSSDDTEMDRMIKGDLYQPFNVQLVEERERCRLALARFNNACNPLSGLTSKEQNRLLKDVLALQPTTMLKPPGSPGISGTMRRPAPSIGPGAIVESPFTCHYGHLSIGEDVMISHNCVFVDDCYIFVGAHTWIGSNVTILTTMAHSSMQERKGTQSRYEGRRVRIMEDCYIGANSTIYPGVTLGRGAYIAPGEIVQRDVVSYGFQGFKPNYM